MLDAKLFITLTSLLAGHSALADTIDWESIANSRGDRLPDFSFCGYHGSDKALPSNSVASLIKIDASTDDQTSKIQKALDKAAAAGGGVVELGAGTFRVSPGLNISSGTTLRGSGIESTRLAVTKLKEAGVPLISFGNGTDKHVYPLLTSSITNDYVGIGANTVTVENATGFKEGETVFVSRAATEEWVRENGMADLVRDDKKQTWVKVGDLIQQPRVIKTVEKNDLTFNIPLTDALDDRYMNSYVAAYSPPPTSQEIGLEDLSITLSPTCSGKVFNVSEPCNSPAVWISPWTVDSYVRRVNMTGFNNFIDIQNNASRITIDNASFFRDRDTDRPGGYPTDINISGSQVLVQDCGQYGLASAKAFTVITQARVPGPNAVLRHVTQSDLQELYPHQRWAHGFLVEDTDAKVTFINRATAGSGQGWPINGGVAWNVRGPIQIQSSPLGVNWAVGSTGDIEPQSNGTMVKTGSSVMPKSLFSAQLKKRGGKVH